MCGVVGYVGSKDAVAVLLDGLRRLEYRGYDSAGVAVLNGQGVETRKLAGRIAALRDLVAREPVHGTCGIGHTRWATHGAPTEQNAHPHTDCTGTLALVHNGIVENADLLRLQLERAGHRFATETDTETLAHLIEAAAGDTLEERVIAALALVEGTYGLAVISDADPRKIVVARRGSPLLIGVGGGECLVASDASAVLAHTRSVVYLDEDRKSTRLNSSHSQISYAVFCLKKKKKKQQLSVCKGSGDSQQGQVVKSVAVLLQCTDGVSDARRCYENHHHDR